MTAEEWNQRYPVGTQVFFWTAFPSKEVWRNPPTMTRTRSVATTLPGGRVVVQLEGFTGFVAISHCLPTTLVIDKCKPFRSMARKLFNKG